MKTSSASADRNKRVSPATPTVQDGKLVITSKHILKAVQATRWTNDQSLQGVAVYLIDQALAQGFTFDWFSSGLDAAIMLKIPAILEASRQRNKVTGYRFKI